MGDGFSINISGQDLKKISDRYSQLRLEYEKSKVDKSSHIIDYLRAYLLLAGFEECLEYVGIDHEIFENGIEPLE